MKILILAIVLLALSGCGGAPIKITTDVKEILVPVVSCPAPPTVEKPTLPIYSITDKDSDGIVVKKYKATIRALKDYAKDLNEVIDSYRTISPE